MFVEIEARILIFPGTDFHFPSTSVPPGTFFRLWSLLSVGTAVPTDGLMPRPSGTTGGAVPSTDDIHGPTTRPTAVAVAATAVGTHRYAKRKGLFAAHELNGTIVTQLHDDAFTGHVRQRHDLIGCSETRSVGARSVRALSTLPLEFTYSLMWEFSSAEIMCCEQTTHTLSFIPDLKPSFSANPPPLQSFFFFFRTDYTIPQTFTVTSEHIRFYFLVFLHTF